jgi:hypothetical protein
LNPALFDSNYSSLKNYCDSLALNPGDSLLGKTAEWFSIKCNIENQDYQEAINSLDSILSNPGTYADSIFALVDLSEVFEEISDSTGLKSSLITQYPQVITNSHRQFISQRKQWIDLLLKSKDSFVNKEVTPVTENIENKPCKINSIFPNPATEFLSVSYSVNIKGRIGISLITNVGKTVQNQDDGIRNPGEYSFIFSTMNYPDGIYFVVLSFDRSVIDTGKLVISH